MSKLVASPVGIYSDDGNTLYLRCYLSWQSNYLLMI